MKVVLYMIGLIFVSQSSFGDGKLPESFDQNGKHYVYADFFMASYELTFDVSLKKAFVKSTITFETSEDGYPLFDLVPKASYAELNEMPTEIPLVPLYKEGTSRKVTHMRSTDFPVEEGAHVLVIENEITKNISFKNDHARFLSHLSDLSDRSFLEAYMPANLAYDQVLMSFRVKVINAKSEQKIITNGKVTRKGYNHWLINYPSYYNTTSVYFHLMNPKEFNYKNTFFDSIDGRKIPITIYKKKSFMGSIIGSGELGRIVKKTRAIFNELEHDYGAWPNNFFKAYIAGSGGMEYSGATRTSLWALGHEMHHAYFARSAQPDSGNSSWIDEALASWRDNNYKKESSFSADDMSIHSRHQRTTDRDAYSLGAKFIGYLDKHLEFNGGLKKGLKSFYLFFYQQIYSTEDLIEHLEFYYKEDLRELFNKAVYDRLGLSLDIFSINENEESEIFLRELENPCMIEMNPSEIQEIL